MVNESTIITTDRLVLRYFDIENDLEPFLEYRNDKEIAEYQGWSIPYTKHQALEFFSEMDDLDIYSTDNWIQIACELSKTGELIGDCAFINRNGIAEIGITIGKKYQRKGFAKEILQALFLILSEKLDIHRIIAKIDVENTSSKKLMESLGMRQEGHFIQSYWDSNMSEYRDEFLYAILREERK